MSKLMMQLAKNIKLIDSKYSNHKIKIKTNVATIGFNKSPEFIH